MRDLSKLNDTFSLTDVKKAYRVNAKKAQGIINDFIKNGVVKFENGVYKKVEKIEAPTTVEVEEEQTTEVQESAIDGVEQKDNESSKPTTETKDKKSEAESESIKDIVIESKLPIPYEVTTDKGVFILNVKNFEELIHVVDRITGYSKAKILKAVRLR